MGWNCDRAHRRVSTWISQASIEVASGKPFRVEDGSARSLGLDRPGAVGVGLVLLVLDHLNHD